MEITPKDSTIFYPAKWPYIFVVVGFIFSAAPILLLFQTHLKNEGFLPILGCSSLSLLFFAPTVNAIYQLLTARIIVTSEFIEYREKWKRCQIPLNQIQSVFVLGLDIYIDYGAPQRLRIPLIFKNSSDLIQILKNRKNCNFKNP